MDEIQFLTLLKRSEGETLDFKGSAKGPPYDFANDESCLAFVKDVLCMWNTPRDESAFIVLGVTKFPDGTYSLDGLRSSPDESNLQALFLDRVYPIPVFIFHTLTYSGQNFAVVEIPPKHIGPSCPTRDKGALLKKWQIYFRRGSRNDIASPEDTSRILTWFGKISHGPAYEADSPAWDTILRHLRNFDSAVYYVVIASGFPRARPIDLAPLGLLPLAAVIDFDPESDIRGLLAAARQRLEERRSLHLLVGRECLALNVKAGTYWFFARGLVGREETIQTGPWKSWLQSHSGTLNGFLRHLGASCSPIPTICLCLSYESSMVRHLQSAIEASLGAFGSASAIVIATDDSTSVQKISEDFDASVVEIPFHQLSSGIASYFVHISGSSSEEIILPSSSGAPIAISQKDQRWIEEELELVDIGSGQTLPPNRQIGREFLRGAEISWYDLGLHYDVDRDVTDRIQRQIERELRARRTSRINLYHAPGAGGTTVAKRILWNLHRQFPCAILKATTPHDTAERAYRITSLAGHPLLLLVDGARIVESQVDQLYDILRSRHIPVVIFQVLRRFNPQPEGTRAFYLQGELTKIEAERFAFVFSREEPDKKPDIEAILVSSDPRVKTAFYFGLLTFQKDFLGLEAYVALRLESLNDSQKKIVGYLSLAHHYAQQSLTGQVFADLLGLSPSKTVNLTKTFPQSTIELLVQTDSGEWRTTHDLIASEILEHLLWPTSQDRRQWKQHLSDWAIDFIELCSRAGGVQSEALLQVIQRMFIFRDNVELLGTERSAAKLFAQIIQDIPSLEGRKLVLTRLIEIYPDEPHFWAHLGRFHSIETKNFPEAITCIDRAIALDNNNSVLHHMRGMAIRKQIYDTIDKGGLLESVIELAKDAATSFSGARNLNPDDEHGYISEVQMQYRILQYAGRQHDTGIMGYLASATAHPYLRDTFEHAEDLLERLGRSREGQTASKYEQDCRAKVDALYGRYDTALQVWDNLLSRKDIYRPPVRRQIIWTYLARAQRSWKALPSKEVDRTISLLEENLREEPNSDTNLRLWVKAVRRSSHPYSLDTVIERVAYWRASAGSLDATYYLYVFYALQAIDGLASARESAERFIEECQTKSRFRRNRTKSFEWLGEGGGVSRLVHQSQLGEWNEEKDFWDMTAPLARVQGRIARIEAQQAGQIEVAGGLKAFFVPARGGFTRGRSENRLVNFYMGFSYDGLRAWDVKDAENSKPMPRSGKD